MPLVMLFLERIHVFSVQVYIAKWRIAVLLMAIAAMVLSPGGDPNGFARKFGPSDWFKVIVTGLNANQQEIGSLEVFLAQGTDILTGWKPVDLSSLADARTLRFAVDSSDKDPVFGWLNTPSYFAMDNLSVVAVPEPSAGVLIVSGLALLLFIRRLRRS